MRVAPVLIVSGLLITACGGGSDSAEPAPTTAPPATTPETSPPETSPPETSPPATDPPEPSPPAIQPPTTEPPPADSVIVDSPDGDLTIRVSGSEHESIAPTIGILDPAEWPPELAGGDNVSGVTIYDLQPSGATFDTPVVITRRVDAASFPELGPFEIPVLTLLIFSDGAYELLDDLSAVRLGDDIYVSGTTTHFSGLVTSNEGSGIQINENLSISGFLDASLQNQEDIEDVEFDLDPIEFDLDFNYDDLLSAQDFVYIRESDVDEFDLEQAFLAYENVDAVPLGRTLLGTYGDEASAIELMYATTGFELPAWAAPSAAQLLGEAIDAEIDTFEYEAALFLATVPDEFYDDALDLVDDMLDDLDADIELIAELFHEEFGKFPSSIRRRFSGLTLQEGLRAFSGLFEGDLDNPRLVSLAAMEEADGELVAESGIECFCEYGEMLFFLDADDADTVEDLVNRPVVSVVSDEFLQFVRDNPDTVAAWTVMQVQAEGALTLAVGGAEGELVNEPVTLTPFP